MIQAPPIHILRNEQDQAEPYQTSDNSAPSLLEEDCCFYITLNGNYVGNQAESKTVKCSVMKGAYRMISMAKQSLREIAFYQILKFLLFLPQQKTPSFFSYVDAEDKISIVVSDKADDAFFSSVSSSMDNQRLLVFHLDSMTMEGTNLMNEIIEPLTQRGIGAISFNTVNCAVILVSNDEYNEVISTLKDCHGLYTPKEIQHAQNESHDPAVGLNSPPSALLKTQTLERFSNLNIHPHRSIVHLSNLPKKLVLCSLPTAEIPANTHAIIRTLFYPSADESDTLSTFAVVNGIVTMSIHESLLHLYLPHSIRIHEEPWKAFKVSKGQVVVSENSIIPEISKLLAENQVAYRYVGTVSSDYLLLECSEIEKAMEKLKQNISISIHFDCA